YRLPELSIAIDDGPLNKAAVAVPLTKLALPEPANVVTTSPVEILRIRLFAKSATYRFPEASSATPHGLLNEAEVPVPLAEPMLPEPATVVTTPVEVIFRIRLFPLSVT